MILKSVDPKSLQELQDPRAAAGHAAERQMAYYLDQAFGEDDNIHVVNDLRLKDSEPLHRSTTLFLARTASSSSKARVSRKR